MYESELSRNDKNQSHFESKVRAECLHLTRFTRIKHTQLHYNFNHMTDNQAFRSTGNNNTDLPSS